MKEPYDKAAWESLALDFAKDLVRTNKEELIDWDILGDFLEDEEDVVDDLLLEKFLQIVYRKCLELVD